MNNIIRLMASGFIAALFALSARAAELAPGAYSAGTVKGDVTYKVPGASGFQKLSPGSALPQGAIIKTGANSSAVLVFGSGSTAVVKALSEVEVTKFEQEAFTGAIPVDSEPAVSNTEIRISNGTVVSKVNKLKKGSNYTVSSPVGAAGVRGTIFSVFYDKVTGNFSIATAEGLVVFSSSGLTTLTEVRAGEEFVGNAIVNADGSITFGGQKFQPLSEEVLREIADAVGGVAGGGNGGGTNGGSTPSYIIDPTITPASPN